MKRLLAAMLSLLMTVSLTACGEKQSAPDALPPEVSSVEEPVTEPDTKPDTAPDAAEPVVLTGDSYWVAYESEGDMREYAPEGDDLLTDLTLWADGTARIREIENELWLISEEYERNLTWTCETDGTLNLYSTYSGDEPCWVGSVTEEGLELSRFGGTFRFKQEPMPEGGALYSPAELLGVWLQVGSEIEGDINESMPGYFDSLVFRKDWDEGSQTLLTSSETGNYDGFTADDNYYGRAITLLDEPIYEGCGNDVWSVRIGEESPLNQYGYPENTETYVTLLDRNTLLRQCYFSFDNGSIPGVSYQTFKCIRTDTATDVVAGDLEGIVWECVSFTGDDGVNKEMADGISGFRLYTDVDGAFSFRVSNEDGTNYNGGGSWSMGDGNTLLFHGPDFPNDWFAGAVRSDNESPEMSLWYNGGVMKLCPVEGEENWDGYADTMNDLEGNAFAAPENAVLVFYGDDYLDMNRYRNNSDIPYYELSDAPDAREILITGVLDNTPVWIEEDGAVTAQLGSLMAGESVIVRLSYPQNGGSDLCFEFGGIEYYIELSHESLSLYMWDYITV